MSKTSPAFMMEDVDDTKVAQPRKCRKNQRNARPTPSHEGAVTLASSGTRRQCDEEHPRCSNCLRLDITCHWPSPHSYGSPSSTPPENHVSMLQERRTFRSPDLSPEFRPTLPIDELRLVHHWIARISYSSDLDHGPDVRIWSIDVCELAFDHPFLLHGLLACAALHKTLEFPQADRAKLLFQADAHMSSSMAVYRHHLEQPSLETALPMFILSSILVTYNLASARIQEPENPIDGIQHCFRLLRGVRIVIGEYWEELKGLPIVVYLLGGITNWKEIPFSKDARFKEILELKQLATQLEEPDRDILRGLSYFDATKHRSRAATLDDRFMELLEAHHPIALVVVAHYAVLLAQARYAWWLEGWPKRIIDASWQLLEPVPELQKWLDWPLEQIKALV
ncbi:hypothetical protein CC78DRAFT_591472 [Lojkania enalia]|uniref:Zn(2)-C6 fungal-type domain-containing protein n=1 Tax=Lojkania enalia TaxID=147567 RepID=A0A9P4JZD3_9PLEO|nr:hypothetical protein CC78DRAFT_591472 [Didymosphaeria enalia]